MSEQKYTPTPWHMNDEDCIVGPDAAGVARILLARGNSAIADANSAFIVRAVNAHEALVEAINLIAQELVLMGRIDRDNIEIRDIIRAALKLASES